MAFDKQAVIDQLSGLTVLELVELVDAPGFLESVYQFHQFKNGQAAQLVDNCLLVESH